MNKLKYPLLVLACSCLIFSCEREGGGGQSKKKESYQVDHSDPAKVLQAVFDVAGGAEASVLGQLCDPMGQNDQDTRRICDLAGGFAPDDEFVLYFRNGKLNGDAMIDGKVAMVPFLFGPDGDREESMKMVQRDDKWYLSAF